MKNFAIKVDGKEYWISRSVAAVVFVVKKMKGKLYLLIEKRGKGAGDNQGKYCVVCGYLDYDETLEECAIRELKEETGFIGDINKLKFIKINSSPTENKQNVAVHYLYEAADDEDFDLKQAIGGEEDEVEEVKWFPIGKVIDDNTIKVDMYGVVAENWAFDHEKRVIEYLALQYNLDWGDEKV